MMMTFYDREGRQIGKIKILPLERRQVPPGAYHVRIW